MRRRNFSKALASIPLVAAAPAHAQESLPYMQDRRNIIHEAAISAQKEQRPSNKFILLVDPDPDGKFAPGLEMLIDRSYKHVKPDDVVGLVFFTPKTRDHRPWLLPPGLSDPTLTTPANILFGQRRFDIIDRAVDLRLSQYFRHMQAPSVDIQQWVARRREARKHLLYVRVTFRTG